MLGKLLIKTLAVLLERKHTVVSLELNLSSFALEITYFTLNFTLKTDSRLMLREKHSRHKVTAVTLD